MGKAIVASDVGGLRELLRDGETARLVRPGDARALAATCAELLSDAAQRARLGKAARAEAVARYDWETVAAGYGEVYAAAGLRSPAAG